jgi:uncharacterized membrane protein HdeD (DUF308 family)
MQQESHQEEGDLLFLEGGRSMQEALTNDRVHVEPYHSGLWWREVLRGSVTILFALLMLFTFNFFIDVLGIYLILDGALEMILTDRRAFLTYLGGLVSIALGAFTLLNPRTTLFVLVVVSLRLILRGGRVILDARHSHSTYEGLAWLLGIALLLGGLILLGNAVRSVLQHNQPYSLIIIVLFMSSYALVDGIYLLARGLLLRLKPAVFIASEGQVGSPPDLLADLPPTTRRAVVFVRYAGAYGLGHVGWAFEWNNGWFNVGSLENEQGNPFASPQEMGFWCAQTLDPSGAMQKRGMTYDAYKVLYVTRPRPKEAWTTVIWESRQPYTVVRHNCSDVVYDILRAYGTSGLLDPVEEPAPNDWYDVLPGRSYRMADYPTIPLHLHLMAKHELASREIMLTIPARVQATPPPWRVDSLRFWQEWDGTWRKMGRDLRTLFVETKKHVTRQRDHSRQGQPHAL